MELNTSEAIQTDLWRLGLLLTGTEDGATAALSRVLRAHDDVRRLAEDRRRRLLILGARDWLAANGNPSHADDSPAGRSVRLASTLEALPREVWALREVMQWNDVETSRAIGIARSAETTYLAQSTAHLRAALADEYEPAIAELRTRWHTVDASAGIALAARALRGVRARRRIIAAVQIIALLGVLSLIAWIGTDLIRASERERANQALQETLSNPMPQPSPTAPPRRSESPR
jgi:hypothetical protein